MARVAVLGASGFLGRHVVDRLRKDDVMIVAVARRIVAGRSPGLRAVPLDVVRARPADLAGAIRGCEAAVNLVGIKRETGVQTFEAVHVGVARTLVAAARLAGIRRVIHVSVAAARPDPGSAYHDTKWRAEQILENSGLDVTILRPGIVYGSGDDMLSHLTAMIRATCFFPIVGSGDSRQQPVHVEDVAAAVSAALRRPESIGRRYDVVGPEPLPLRRIVRDVAEALGLDVCILPTPPWVMRSAVCAMNAVCREPLSTPAQLRMLIDGMTGDPEAMGRELGIRPRPFTVEGIRPVVRSVPLRFAWSFRWFPPRPPLVAA